MIEFDWRPEGILNPIRNQRNGKSCFAFTTCAVMEALYHLTTGKRGDDRIILSPQDIYNNLISNDIENEDGRTIPQTLDWLMENSSVLDIDCPCKETYKVPEKQRNVKLRFETFIPLQNNEKKIEEEVQIAPVAAEMYWIPTMTDFEKEDIYYTPDKSVLQSSEMHGVVIVRFGKSVGEKGKMTKFWIIRNSHGPDWGERGYAKIERSLVTAAWAIRGISLNDFNGIPYDQ